VLLWVGLGVGVCQGANLQKTCSLNPTMDEDNAVQEGGSFTLQCSFSGGGNGGGNDGVDFCQWTHYSVELDQPTNTDTLLINCKFAADQNGQNSGSQCPTRVQGTTTSSGCSITVQQSTNEDTGLWKMTAVSISTLNNQVNPSTNEFDVYTFNETNVDILGTLPNQNNQRTQQSSYQVAYNWNDRNEDWEDDGNRQFDQLEFYCQAPGARPNPQFKWYIGQGRGQEIQGTDDFLKLSDPQNHRGSSIRQYGYRGMIQDYESQLTMKIDQDLLDFLNTRANIDTNPEQGNFQFDLTCEVDTSGNNGNGGQSGNNMQTVTVMVTKSYDNGMLPASTIGIIVGCIVAGVLVVVAISLLLFARSRSMWCFDDYNDANDPRSRPQQAGLQQGPAPNQPPQQRPYRR